MKQVIRYKCDFCNKVMATSKGMERHEKQCFKNPNGFNCYMCEHAYLGIAYCDNPYTGGQNEYPDKPICSINEDWIIENFALKCSYYKRAESMYYDREIAEDGTVKRRNHFDAILL